MTCNSLGTRVLRFALSTSLLAVLALTPRAQGARTTDGLSREEMWTAPTAEDWKKPCLVTWQRSFEDAGVLSLETGKPILVCVNMDGEIASEHYAGIRYRQPEVARLYEPYVTVIASVYRHTPRDYDEQGRRVLCPRFGSVTCGEHIAIEPILYEKYFEGERVAPRHIMLELDGAETYDVYYAFDTASVFDSIKAGIANRPAPPPIVRGERTIAQRVDSRDVEDREAVETAYMEGDDELRRELLEAALASPNTSQVDLLRLAIFGLDVELSQLARQGLARATSADAVGLIAEALRVPMAGGERDALIGALERLGETSPQARTLAVVHHGLARKSEDVDVDDWAKALENAKVTELTLGWDELEAKLENQYEATQSRVETASSQLELAESSLALAVDPQTASQLGGDSKTQSKYARLMFEDAQLAAMQAEELGATGWRVDAVLALSAYYLDDLEQAVRHAEWAAAALPPGEQGWNAMAVLALFAQGRQYAIEKAVREKADWPPEWLTDVNAAYDVLAKHPLGTDHQVAMHQDFLRRLGAGAKADRVLDEGLARFPDSWALHQRMRGRILGEKGVAGLEPAYEAMLARESASPRLEWFAGYTSIIAAEFHRRANDNDAAAASYDRAIAHYDRAIASYEDCRDSSNHYVAVALAGRGRIALEGGDLDAALADLLASFERRPNSANTLDGLNLSAVDTAKMLRARLTRAERTEQVASLQVALDALDPAMLELPAFENPSGRPSFDRPPDGGRDRGRNGGGGQGRGR